MALTTQRLVGKQMTATQPQFSFDDPLAGLKLSARERIIAERVMRATSSKPVRIKELRTELAFQGLQVSERTVKDIVRTLRKDHQLRILARREQPAGYYWCASVDEMKEFIAMFRSQALDELHSLSRVVKANYPELAGQLRIEINAEA